MYKKIAVTFTSAALLTAPVAQASEASRISGESLVLAMIIPLSTLYFSTQLSTYSVYDVNKDGATEHLSLKDQKTGKIISAPVRKEMLAKTGVKKGAVVSVRQTELGHILSHKGNVVAYYPNDLGKEIMLPQ